MANKPYATPRATKVNYGYNSPVSKTVYNTAKGERIEEPSLFSAADA